MKEYIVNNFKAINYQYAVGQLFTCVDLEGCSLKTMMFEKYPSISPYTYCANNPMKYVDPTGKTVVITGDEADGALADMASKSKNLKFEMNSYGKVSIIGGKAKTKEEKYMQKMINDQDVTVNIRATNNETTSSGEFFDIGACMGNKVEKDANGNVTHVNAYQEYNVNKGRFLDGQVNTPGDMIWHEIAEGYEGGKISMITGISEKPAFDNGKPNIFYDDAHGRANLFFLGDYHMTVKIMALPFPEKIGGVIISWKTINFIKSISYSKP
ncbi:MAG: hypothetical protein PHI52_08115 [Bacteroidales bacterium]|nr:hypothetical protein [Bacteroidales bacterium]